MKNARVLLSLSEYIHTYLPCIWTRVLSSSRPTAVTRFVRKHKQKPFVSAEFTGRICSCLSSFQTCSHTLMFVSMEPEARKSPNGWKARQVMLALCPIRVLKTGEDRKHQSHRTDVRTGTVLTELESDVNRHWNHQASQTPWEISSEPPTHSRFVSPRPAKCLTSWLVRVTSESFPLNDAACNTTQNVPFGFTDLRIQVTDRSEDPFKITLPL